MASSSPAPSSNSTETTPTAIPPTVASAAVGTPFLRTDTAPKTQRGLNKPKCIQCGNVARSRCPYRSCKSCCSKAQNPCHIHVLKTSNPFPEKTPTSSSPSVEQKSTEDSSTGMPRRMPSLRQLSTAFAQFNNLQMPIRPKKHLTRKEAAALNDWRFSKLKEFKDRNLEAENEAFDRYMQNITLLEEILDIKSNPEGDNEDGCSVSNLDHGLRQGDTGNHGSRQGDAGAMTAGMRLKLRTDPTRADNYRKRIQHIVDEGLKKLDKFELDNSVSDSDDQNKMVTMSKKAKSVWTDRASALGDLIEKLNKARGEEDLKSCLEMKAQLYPQSTSDQPETKAFEPSMDQATKNGSTPKRVTEYCLPKLVTTTEIDQETLNRVDAHFSTLEQIEDL